MAYNIDNKEFTSFLQNIDNGNFFAFDTSSGMKEPIFIRRWQVNQNKNQIFIFFQNCLMKLLTTNNEPTYITFTQMNLDKALKNSRKTTISDTIEILDVISVVIGLQNNTEVDSFKNVLIDIQSYIHYMNSKSKQSGGRIIKSKSTKKLKSQK